MKEIASDKLFEDPYKTTHEIIFWLSQHARMRASQGRYDDVVADMMTSLRMTQLIAEEPHHAARSDQINMIYKINYCSVSPLRCLSKKFRRR